jgi:glutamine---fructose-6-phosphate transaminase (isomerizing)
VTGPGERMAVDMAAQPAVLRALTARRAEVIGSLRGPRPAGVVIVARGSSDYAAIFGRYLLEAATGRPVALAAASLQTLYGVELQLDGWLAVGISQSGRTPEIATVLDRYRRAGARTVAVTNEPASPLASAASVSLPLGAGEEGAVPATKTFTAQLAAMALLAEALGPVAWGAGDWRRLPELLEEVLADPGPAERAAAALGDAHELVAVGRGYLMCVALEAALKLREATGVRAEGWSVADFRHGPVTAAGDQRLGPRGGGCGGAGRGARARRHAGADAGRPPRRRASLSGRPGRAALRAARHGASTAARARAGAASRARPGRAAAAAQGHADDVTRGPRRV